LAGAPQTIRSANPEIGRAMEVLKINLLESSGSVTQYSLMKLARISFDFI
jgi:hypothetical protein